MIRIETNVVLGMEVKSLLFAQFLILNKYIWRVWIFFHLSFCCKERKSHYMIRRNCICIGNCWFKMNFWYIWQFVKISGRLNLSKFTKNIDIFVHFSVNANIYSHVLIWNSIASKIVPEIKFWCIRKVLIFKQQIHYTSIARSAVGYTNSWYEGNFVEFDYLLRSNKH